MLRTLLLILITTAQLGLAAPAWVKSYATHAKLGQRNAFDTVLLRELTLTPASKTEIHTRMVILNGGEGKFSDCVEHASYSGKNSFKNEAAWVIYPDGKIKQADATSVTINNLWSETILYSDDYVATFRLDNVPIGSIICIEYETTSIHLLDVGHVFLQEEGRLVDSTAIHFPVPDVAVVRFRPHNIADSLIDLDRHSFRAGPTARFQSRSFDGGFAHAAARVEWALFAEGDTLRPPRSWSDVANEVISMWSSVSRKLPAHDYLPAQNAETCALAVQPLLRRFETDFRYVAVEIGKGERIPHKPADVLRYSYGDCKDLSFFLTNVLRQSEVQMTPLLVMSPCHALFDPGYPSQNQFNHVITAMVCEGDTIYYDPTARGYAFGQLPWSDQGAHALWLRAGADLITLPQDIVPMRHSRTITGEVSAAGTLTGSFSVRRDSRTPRKDDPYTKKRR